MADEKIFVHLNMHQFKQSKTPTHQGIPDFATM